MNIEALRNIFHREAQRVLDRRTRRVPCVVDSYNGQNHTVKVKLRPEGTLSGWMQIETAQVGLVIAPNIGDPGWIEFHENDRRAGVFVASNHNNNKPPPKQINAGEFYYQNAKGQWIYVKNDGSITSADGAGASLAMQDGKLTATDKANSTLILNGDNTASLTASGGLTINANVAVNGSVTATQDVKAGSISLQDHVHGGVQGGAGDTGPPTG
jgi:phage baseplate assembly protein gpV